MAIALVNGKSFSHVDISTNIMGTPITSISKIKYDESSEKGFHYGTGSLPNRYSVGKTNPIEGSFEISLKEYQMLKKASGGNFLAITGTDIKVSFNNAPDSFTDTLKFVLFKKVGQASEDGNYDLKVDVDFIAVQLITT